MCIKNHCPHVMHYQINYIGFFMGLKLRDFTENNFQIILEIVYIQSLIYSNKDYMRNQPVT